MKTPFYLFFFSFFCMALLFGAINAMDNEQQQQLDQQLLQAARQGQEELAKKLVESGANVNARDNDGFTPLHYAVDNGLGDLIDTLLRKKADVNVQTNDGETPLHVAALNGNLTMVRLLLGFGANSLIRDTAGGTALDYVPLTLVHDPEISAIRDLLINDMRSKVGVTPEATPEPVLGTE